ncbi:MAG: hypothetical protein KDD70_16075, partial [Bdellovibrionales bacterium]|nr:hypothetical protein [Bdellovibrionales bacterium]
MSESEDNRESVMPEAKSVKPTPCSSSREDFESNIQKYVADWDKIQSALKEELDPQVYQAYIRPLRFVTYQKHSKLLSLEAPSRFVRQHVDSHFGKQLERKCDSLFGPSVSIEYTVSTERSAVSTERSAVSTERSAVSTE